MERTNAVFVEIILDIVAKVTSDPNILYCKDCRDEEVQRLGRNFDLMKFVCIRCGSTNVKKDDLRTVINEDVIVRENLVITRTNIENGISIDLG